MRASLMAIAAAGGLGLSVLALAAPGTAQAAQVLNFSGACSDCAGVGTGVLTLTDGASGALTKADFISFVYKSNLVSFKLDSSSIVAVTGSMDPNNLGATYIDLVQLGGTGWEFTRQADGSWSVSDQMTHGMGNLGGGGGGGFTGGGSGTDSGAPGGSNGSGGGSFTETYGGAGSEMVDDFGTNSVVTSVPEPAAWALMILGFGGVGALARGRRRSFAGIETA